MASIFKKALNMLDPNLRFLKLARCGYYNYLSDEEFIKRKFKAKFGYDIDLDNPKTYNEKQQWLKLHDRKDYYSKLVDKYAVKDYVAKIIGDEYIVKNYGVWDKFDDIDFDSLPNSFVLKCTHDSGGVVVCPNKEQFDIKKAKKKITKSLKNEFFYSGREWPYKNVKPRIIAEEYLHDGSKYGIRDYKFFCFNGVPQLMFIASERMNSETGVKFDFFDMDFNHLEFTNGHPYYPGEVEKPVNFELMKKLSAQLSQGFCQIRVDFYDVNGKVYFGELTLFHHSGFEPFVPNEWDDIIGKMFELPEKNA